jgi:sugar/nucleoside kinase (ribokinase family)
MPGGTSFYFSNAVRQMPLRYLLVTALGETEMPRVSALREQGIDVQAYPSKYSVYFENIYGENPDHRTQRVLRKADAFQYGQVAAIEAAIFHLGPLLADDMSVDFIRQLATRSKVSLDVQGFLRTVENKNVKLIDWKDKRETLEHISILKANDQEMEVITGCGEVREGASMLAEWGVEEVVITLGSRGSVIYTNGQFYDIPVFIPRQLKDTTGCGDTYMAGYLSQRRLGKSPSEAGEFASAMAALKIESHGPFTGTEKDVNRFIGQREKVLHAI